MQNKKRPRLILNQAYRSSTCCLMKQYERLCLVTSGDVNLYNGCRYTNNTSATLCAICRTYGQFGTFIWSSFCAVRLQAIVREGEREQIAMPEISLIKEHTVALQESRRAMHASPGATQGMHDARRASLTAHSCNDITQTRNRILSVLAPRSFTEMGGTSAERYLRATFWSVDYNRRLQFSSSLKAKFHYAILFGAGSELVRNQFGASSELAPTRFGACQRPNSITLSSLLAGRRPVCGYVHENCKFLIYKLSKVMQQHT